MAAYAIKNVRSIQPDGPYYLGGHGHGGVVAFEMAQQLQRKGEKVAVLILCECWTPGPRPPAHGTSSAYRLWQKVNYHLRRRRRGGAKQELSNLFEMLKNKAKGTSRRRQSVAGTRSQQDDRTAIFEAIERYVPQAYSDQITVIRCSERVPWIHHDPLYGWGEFATNGIEAYEIPGSHVGIYKEPYVGMLASRLTDVLSEAQALVENAPEALSVPVPTEATRQAHHSLRHRPENHHVGKLG